MHIVLRRRSDDIIEFTERERVYAWCGDSTGIDRTDIIQKYKRQIDKGEREGGGGGREGGRERERGRGGGSVPVSKQHYIVGADEQWTLVCSRCSCMSCWRGMRKHC